jgi:hypothetical protein
MLRAEACYQALYSDATVHIDDDGVRLDPARMHADPFVTYRTKWGLGSPFAYGQDVPGPGIHGGTVTYSFMTNGVSMVGDQAASTANIAVSGLPGFQACFLTRITGAFAAWTAIANIQFVQAIDNGMAFNIAGASGDIRIGMHGFDGASGTLAHGYYPPPNGSSAAGDLHFDMDEPWTCAPNAGGFDIGIVALHEIGHGIGLGHEPTKTAVMNPYYSSSGGILWPDDINGGRSIYGTASAGAPVSSDDLVVDLGPANGLSVLVDGSGWTSLHGLSPKSVATGDLDANGIDEIVIDFAALGIWVRLNNTSWMMLHAASANRMVTGDLDGNGRDEVIIDFPGDGLWVWANNGSWFKLHPSSSNNIVTGDMDGNGRDEAIIDFPGFGVWVWRNNLSWFQLHGFQSSRITVADGDGNGMADVAVSFANLGIWTYVNNTAWSRIHPTDAARMTAGDMDGNGKSDLIVDFGTGVGIWALMNASGWTNLHMLSSVDMVTGDLNGNGKAEVIINFGASGLWAWADHSAWIRLHAAAPEGMAVGDLNAP